MNRRAGVPPAFPIEGSATLALNPHHLSARMVNAAMMAALRFLVPRRGRMAKATAHDRRQAPPDCDPKFRLSCRGISSTVSRMLGIEQLAELLEQHRTAAAARVNEFTLGGRSFAFNSRGAIMGVINLSADSWYRESVCLNTESAVNRGRVLRDQGADLVDVGAESTLAHAGRVDDTAQSRRLLPVVKALHSAGILTSVETYHAFVAQSCLEAGAKVLNLTGSQPGPEVYRMVAAHDAAVILCYVQGKNVREVGDFEFGADPVARMHDYFARETDLARQQGVTRIILDPGLGFYYRNLQDSAVRVKHQMTVFLSTFRLRALGFPICHALPHAFEFFREEVRCAEAFFAVLAALGKTDLFRTHEVPRVKAVLDTLACY
jgi:dihydropteroate synthase